MAFVHVHNHSQSKLDSRVVKCLSLGHSSTQKGYKFYHPSSRKLLTSMDVTFFKHQSYYINTHLQGDNSIEDGMPLLHLNPTLSLPDFESPSAPAYSLNSTYV